MNKKPNTPANTDRPDATDVFHTFPVRLIGERDEREEQAGRSLSYFHPYLDDLLRGILPHDLVLLTAPTGIGKTDMALSIATSNALKEVRVGYFALEAEPRELERRAKFAWISAEAWRRNIDRRGELNYTDWLMHRCEDIVGSLDEEADRYIAANLSTLWTFYRGQRFGADHLREQVLANHKLVDMLVIDHLHYVDLDDSQEEHRAMGELIKVIRDVALDIGKPIIAVAHLRKRDARMKQLVPTYEDIHGSSNITKVCTQIITLSPASAVVDAPKWWLAPTFMAVLKDRRAGAQPFVALTMFDRRTRRYAEDYTLGRMVKGGTDWEQIKPTDRPGWANSFKQLEMDL